MLFATTIEHNEFQTNFISVRYGFLKNGAIQKTFTFLILLEKKNTLNNEWHVFSIFFKWLFWSKLPKNKYFKTNALFFILDKFMISWKNFISTCYEGSKSSKNKDWRKQKIFLFRSKHSRIVIIIFSKIFWTLSCNRITNIWLFQVQL